MKLRQPVAKAVIVGASSGIGKSVARQLAEEGFAVGLLARRVGRLSQICTELESCGSSVVYRQLDIRDLGSVEFILTDLLQGLGGADLFFICAETGDLNDSLDFAIERKTIETNVLGFTCVVDFTVNFLLKQGYGRLVIISSITALRGGWRAPAYGASKAYVSNYAEALRIKFCKSGLPVFLIDVRSGFVDTRMAKGEKNFWMALTEKAAK